MYLIRYAYPGTVSGQPVGQVYVTGPHLGLSVYSHTYRVAEAAKWETEEKARRDLSRHRWPRAIIIAETEAKDLLAPVVSG